jgi:hypothetical protein
MTIEPIPASYWLTKCELLRCQLRDLQEEHDQALRLLRAAVNHETAQWIEQARKYLAQGDEHADRTSR